MDYDVLCGWQPSEVQTMLPSIAHISVTGWTLLSTSTTAVLLQWCRYARVFGGSRSVHVGVLVVLVGTSLWLLGGCEAV